MTPPGRAAFRLAGLAAGIVVFASPQLSPWSPGSSAWYLRVTAVFSLLIVGLVVTWPRGDRGFSEGDRSLTPAVLIVAGIAGVIVSGWAYRWIRLVAVAAGWLAVLMALLLAFDVQGFTMMGHTAVYWPLFPLLAAAIARSRWRQSACLLAVLVLARTTMVAIVPVF